MKIIPVGEFQTHCLNIMDRENLTREPVVITQKGCPAAKLGPAGPAPRDFLGALAGVLRIQGDIGSLIVPPQAWEVLR